MQLQPFAAAYAKNREAIKRRKMWRGGEVDQYGPEEKEQEVVQEPDADHMHDISDEFDSCTDMEPNYEYEDFLNYSQGGEVEDDEKKMKPKNSFAKAIMQQRRLR